SENLINKASSVSSEEFFSESFINLVVNFFEEFGSIVAEFASEVIEAKKKIPQANYDLSMYGWYINSDFRPGAAIKLVDKLNQGNIDAVDKWFMNYFNINKLQDIEERLSNQYPNRIRFLKSGFNNYKKEDYAASISTLLPQI